MSAPIRIEREHYQKLVGCQILGIYWDELEGPPFWCWCSAVAIQRGLHLTARCWLIPQLLDHIG
jgi:hypothetical protein